MPKIRLRPDGEDFESPEPKTSPSENDHVLPDQPSPNGPRVAIKTSEDLHEAESSEAIATPVPERPEVPASAKMLPELVLPDAAQQMSLHEAMSNDMTPTGENPDVESDQTVDDTQHVGSGSSGADLLLPLIIYAIVKSNPARLVSHLLFIQRYRTSNCATGEANYVTVNITAAVEFLENVDLADLGLSSTDKVMRCAPQRSVFCAIANFVFHIVWRTCRPLALLFTGILTQTLRVSRRRQANSRAECNKWAS